MREYPKVLQAVASAERSLWPVVDAVVEEIETTKDGNARHGEYERCATYLAENGFREWSGRRLRKFREVGVWVESGRQAAAFTGYPLEWVLEAKAAAKSDHERALAILAEATSKRDIRPDKPVPRSREQLKEEVKRDPSLVADAIAESKEVADKVVAHPTARVRVDAAVARSQEKAREQVRERDRDRQESLGPDAEQGALLMQVSSAAYRVTLAALQAGRVWNEVAGRFTDDAHEVALDQVAQEQIRVNAVFDAMRGADLDAVLAQILAEGEASHEPRG